MRTARLTVEQGPALLGEVIQDMPAFWGERDMRSLHHPIWFRQFADDAFMLRDGDQLVGYLLGVTRAPIGYVHLVATRRDRRNLGMARRLYEAFKAHARERGGLGAPGDHHHGQHRLDRLS